MHTGPHPTSRRPGNRRPLGRRITLLPWVFAAVLGTGSLIGTPVAAAAPAFISCPAQDYQNSSGNCIPRPEAAPDGSAPAGATAQCRDGEYSFSQHRRGTCSGHGGVARWL
ncbi:DUF3761 domain-containing protein [Nocardia macrotermitis]|uniref:DUF3761 domain-containing protein n=1 Tax=Nocardia macrotermitis TaxID=2585198 RepID=A0A7K0D5S4_9NOCA|nr:DUF3761 domain-containing protein [Nocardia macrotermitis]MQY21080.1 hypothetical protein [Nocardia macrotermitis]